MKTTCEPPPSFSDKALARFQQQEGRAILLADWQPALFVHFAVPSRVLQPAVPYPLDCYDGKTFVSLVAFSFSNFRVRGLGRAGALVLRPFLDSHFLNVRTYVRGPQGPGIFFLREFLSNPLSVLLGPPTFGLPYRCGRLRYEGGLKLESFRVQTRLEGAECNVVASRPGGKWNRAELDSLAEFLLERYVAYTVHRGRARYFRIWHEPWQQAVCDVALPQLLPDSLGPWSRSATFAGGNLSPGVRDVWLGRPRRTMVNHQAGLLPA